VDGEEVRAVEHLLQVGEFGAELFGALLADVRVEGDELHPERAEPLGHLLADAAQPDDAERLVVHLGAEELALGPLATLEADVCLRDGAGGGERHRDAVFGGGTDVAVGGVRDDDAVVGRGVDVDVVHADAGAADDDEFRGGLEQVAVHLGPGADDQRVRIRDGLKEDVALHVVRGHHVVAGLAEPFQAGVRDGIRDEYLHGRENRAVGVNASFLGVA